MKTTLLILCAAFAAPVLHAKPPEKEKVVAEEATVTIGGQVRRPGPVKFTKGMTLYQALQAGGGATEFGAVRRLALTRDGKVQTIDLTKDESKVMLAQPNDTLEVPSKNLIGR